MNQRGIAAGFMIVGILMLLLTVWGAGASMLAKKRAGDLKTEKASHEQTRAEYAGFKLEVERLGKEAQVKAEAEAKRQKGINDGLSKRLKALGGVNAELRADLLRLRERPPERPDGSAVPIASIGSQGTGGPGAAECVPVEEYRQIEARAAYDARTITLWREWASSQGLIR